MTDRPEPPRAAATPGLVTPTSAVPQAAATPTAAPVSATPTAAPVASVPATAALARLADQVLPALVARLDVSALGELEIRHDGWRVRLRRSTSAAAAAMPAGAVPPSTSGPSHGDSARGGVTSPAVGYYLPNDRTPVGRAVASGDVLGWVEVLGVRQEVVAPRDGVVGRHLAEAGQAVEYGQELVVIDTALRAPDPAAAGAPAGTGAAD